MKSDQDRFDDTVQYIHASVDSALAHHLGVAIQAGNTTGKAVGADISLGSRPDSKGDPGYAAHSERRRAVRALLLCQRVYFSRIWAEEECATAGGMAASFNPKDRFPLATPTWKQTKAASLALWGGRSEIQLIDGIRTFTVTSGRASDAAAVATRHGDATLKLPMLDLTRGADPFPGHTTCYSAVAFWLFQAGLVSYRWMMRNGCGEMDIAGLKRAFGDGRIIWAADTPFTASNHLPTVPAGHIVHLYADNVSQWRGHWLISVGDGTAYGQNNDVEGGRVSNFYDLCNLDRQFLAYKGKVMGHGEKEFTIKGIAEVFDPTQLPNRL